MSGTGRADDSAVLTPGSVIVLPGPAAKFAYMGADPRHHHIFASHPGSKSLTVIKTKSGKAKEIDLGAEINSVKVDEADDVILAGGEGKKLFALDRKTLAVKASMDLPDEGDDIELDTKSGMLYVDNDEETHVWVVDPRAMKITATIDIPKDPEYMVYDDVTDKLYQNIKSTDETLVIDPETNTVEAHWTIGPAKSPHGLALDSKTQRLFVAGGNSKLAVLDARTGKLLGSVDIGPRVDQIVFDPSTKRVYCPSRTGVLSVVQETEDSASLLANVAIPAGAHTLTVDPSTHDVWISYIDKDHSYIQSFTVTAQAK
jgi:DNA-binding beta-propeller fold protein YncE